jgi:hypothetical protein
LPKITSPLSFLEPAMSAAWVCGAAAAAELAPGDDELEGPELLHAAAPAMRVEVIATVAARCGQWNLDIFFLLWKIADLL